MTAAEFFCGAGRARAAGDGPVDAPGRPRPRQVASARVEALQRSAPAQQRRPLDESVAALPEISSLSPANRGLANELSTAR